jgi:antitoxin FitA
MSLSITLKNIPDDVYAQLKASAEAHRRSLNSEAIVCLEGALLPGKVSPSERLERARALRASLQTKKFDHAQFDAAKRVGRK